MIESIFERMKAVAEMLGLELGEEFDIDTYSCNPCRITERGLFDCENDNESGLITELLTGDSSIIKRPKAPAQPWKPKEGERYCHLEPTGLVGSTTYYPTIYLVDALNYHVGNCFPDEKTALANRDIILQKFKTREITPASWTPEDEEGYWGFYDDETSDYTWYGNTADYMRKAVGNLYRTEAEALADYPNLRKRLGMPE